MDKPLTGEMLVAALSLFASQVYMPQVYEPALQSVKKLIEGGDPGAWKAAAQPQKKPRVKGVKRGLAPYNFFVQLLRRTLDRRGLDTRTREVIKVASMVWKSLTPEQHAEFAAQYRDFLDLVNEERKTTGAKGEDEAEQLVQFERERGLDVSKTYFKGLKKLLQKLREADGAASNEAKRAADSAASPQAATLKGGGKSSGAEATSPATPGSAGAQQDAEDGKRKRGREVAATPPGGATPEVESGPKKKKKKKKQAKAVEAGAFE